MDFSQKPDQITFWLESLDFWLNQGWWGNPQKNPLTPQTL